MTYCQLSAAISPVYDQVHSDLDERHCEHTGSFPLHFIFLRLEMDSELGESQRRKNAPASFTRLRDPAWLDLEGLGIGEGRFTDADTIRLLEGSGGKFSGHDGWVERRLH